MRSLHTVALGLTLGFALLTAAGPAAARDRARQRAEPTPAWATPEGREAARLDLVIALLEAGRPEEALELTAQLRRDGAPPAELDVYQAEALIDIGLLDDAEELLGAYLKRYPRDARAHNQRGILHMERKRIDAAVVSFTEAVRHNADDPAYQNNLGFALMSAGKAAPAVEDLRTSLKLDGARAQTRNNLGFALVAAQREGEALRVFRAAGSEADAHYNVGVGLMLRGAAPEARAQFERALSRDPNHPHAQAALQRLGATEESPR